MLQPEDFTGTEPLTPATTALTVTEIYEAQKAELAQAIRRALQAAFPLDYDVQAIARLMHNLAGTSAYFGEAVIGEHAARIEHPLRSANNPHDIKALCRQMLSLLG